MALIRCPECDTEVSDQALSCPKCGFPFDKKIPSEKSIQPQGKPRKKTRMGLILAILIIGLIGILSLLTVPKLLEYRGNSKGSIFDLIPQERAASLAYGSIIVKPNQRRYYEFNTQKSWRNIHVKGSFTASGGSGNDIRVLLMTKNDFINFTNGHKYQRLYDSGQTSVSDLDVFLASDDGKYVLAFDNSFSLFTKKEVNADISLIATY